MFAIITLLLVLFHHTTAWKVIDFKYRIDGYSNKDFFGFSMDTHTRRLVIGAPFDNGYRGTVTVGQGVKLKGMTEHEYFGWAVAVNHKYLVVSGRCGETLYIYLSTSPYTLVHTIPVRKCSDPYDAQMDVGDDHTIALTVKDRSSSALFVYHYDGATWYKAYEKIWDVEVYRVYRWGPSVSINNNNIAIGMYDQNTKKGFVHMFNRQKGQWSLIQAITPSGQCEYFGISVMISDKQLVVGSWCHFLFVYKQLNGTTWIDEARIHHQGNLMGGVAIHKDIIAATSAENRVSVLYKRVGKDRWAEYAQLKGEEIKAYDEMYRVVRIQGNLVFTAKYYDDCHSLGAVYVHDITQEN